MALSYDKSAAVVVLPAVHDGRIKDPQLRRWIAKSQPRRQQAARHLLAGILRVLRLPCPESGLAALRMWGQTGERPSAWICAADPVYLEPRLDHLCLHALTNNDVPPAELRPLIDHLQRVLADNTAYGFARISGCGYLSANAAIATATLPPGAIDQQKPDDYMPGGDTAAAYRSLISEIEMALHDHEINRQRELAGRPPVNSLWLWGGGVAPPQKTSPLPPLFGDDPLLKGYWHSNLGVAEPWAGASGVDGIRRCLQLSVGGFVAVVPEALQDTDYLEGCLRELRAAIRERRLSSLTLIFRDGIEVEVLDQHRFRLWHRRDPLLDETAQ